MCDLCKKATRRMTAKRPLSATETRTMLDSIAVAIASGAKPDHFQKLLDKVLGTEIPKTDADLDAAWERGRESDG